MSSSLQLLPNTGREINNINNTRLIPRITQPNWPWGAQCIHVKGWALHLIQISNALVLCRIHVLPPHMACGPFFFYRRRQSLTSRNTITVRRRLLKSRVFAAVLFLAMLGRRLHVWRLDRPCRALMPPSPSSFLNCNAESALLVCTCRNECLLGGTVQKNKRSARDPVYRI